MMTHRRERQGYAAFTWNPTDGKLEAILVGESRVVKFEEADKNTGHGNVRRQCRRKLKKKCNFLLSSVTATYDRMLRFPLNASFRLKPTIRS